MSLENATPRSWVVDDDYPDVYGGASAITGRPVLVAQAETLANAELIVTAVNQHEALLDALKAIRDLCDTPSLGETLGNSIAIRSVAEQAIRAAEGGSER